MARKTTHERLLDAVKPSQGWLQATAIVTDYLGDLLSTTVYLLDTERLLQVQAEYLEARADKSHGAWRILRERRVGFTFRTSSNGGFEAAAEMHLDLDEEYDYDADGEVIPGTEQLYWSIADSRFWDSITRKVGDVERWISDWSPQGRRDQEAEHAALQAKAQAERDAAQREADYLAQTATGRAIILKLVGQQRHAQAKVLAAYKGMISTLNDGLAVIEKGQELRTFKVPGPQQVSEFHEAVAKYNLLCSLVESHPLAPLADRLTEEEVERLGWGYYGS